MAYNPKADPYYADLFDATPTSFAEDYQTSLTKFRQQESQKLQNEATQLRLEQAQQEAEREARIKENLQGVSYDDPDIYEKAQQAYGKEGQIDKVIELQKIKDSMASQQEARDSRELSIINGVKDPYLQAEMWNKSKYAERYGTRDAGSFQDQKLQIGYDGRVIDMNSLKPGQVVPGFKAPREAREEKPSLKAVYDPSAGKDVYVNMRDPDVMSKLASQQLLPPKGSSQADAPLESLGSSPKMPKKISNAEAAAIQDLMRIKGQYGNNINIQSMIKKPTVK